MLNQTCVPREKLVEYFQGWSDEDSSQHIEVHLQHCADCESELERIEKQQRPIEGLNLDPSEDSLSAKNEAAAEEDGLPDDLAAMVRSISNWDINAPELPHSEIGNYQIVELIGRGGMAEVYRAKQKKLQRDVAIKVLHVPKTKVAESLQRIEREMAAVGRLNHPGIVSAIDTGEINGNPFLVTEFIDGLDVSRLSRILGPLPVADACEIVRQAAIALANAHGQGIIHRDLKPSNLMIDKAGSVKVLDFGLAHLEDESQSVVELTTVGQLLGTLDYMAPEQAEQAHQVDHRSDVYSLGATLFRLLSGRAPYAATTRQSALEKLRLLATTQPPRISTLRHPLDNGLSKLVDRTLARAPDQRPASAAHLAEALEPYCDGADLSALVNSAWEKREQVAEEAIESSMLLSAGNKAAPSNGRGGWRGWPMLLGFAGMFAALWLGIVITLDTMKGQVVIQTDAADVKVHLLKDGKQYKELEIQPGTNSTRLYAGQYEIQIEAGTDHYLIDNEQFKLNSGETVVATVRLQNDQRSEIPDTSVNPQDDAELKRIWIQFLAAETSVNNKEAEKFLRAIVLLNRPTEVRKLIIESIEMLNQRRDSVLDRHLSFAIREFGLDRRQAQMVLKKAFENDLEDYYTEVIPQLVEYSKKHPTQTLNKEIVECMWFEIEKDLELGKRESILKTLRTFRSILQNTDDSEHLKQVYNHPKLGMSALIEAGYWWPWLQLDDRDSLLEKTLQILAQDDLDPKVETSATYLLVTLCTEEPRSNLWLWRKDLPAELSAEIEDTLSKIAEGILGTEEMYAYVEGGIQYTPVNLPNDRFLRHLATRFTGLPSDSVHQRFQLLLYLIKSAGDATHPQQPNPIFAKVAELDIDSDAVRLLGKSHSFSFFYKMAENGRYYPESGIVEENGETVVLDRETISPIFIQRVAANILKGYSNVGDWVEAEGTAAGPAVEQLLANLKSAQTIEEMGAAARAINLADAQQEAQEVLTQRIIEMITSKDEFDKYSQSETEVYIATKLVSSTGIPLGEKGFLEVLELSVEKPTTIGYQTLETVLSESNLRDKMWEKVWQILDDTSFVPDENQRWLVARLLLFGIDHPKNRTGAGIAGFDETERRQVQRFFLHPKLGLRFYLQSPWRGLLRPEIAFNEIDRVVLLQQAVEILEDEAASEELRYNLLSNLELLFLQSNQVPYTLNQTKIVWVYHKELCRETELSQRLLVALKKRIESELDIWLVRRMVPEVPRSPEYTQLSETKKHWSCQFANSNKTMLLGQYLMLITDRIEQSMENKGSEESVRSLIRKRTKDAYDRFLKQLEEADCPLTEPLVVRVLNKPGPTEDDWMLTQVFTGSDGRYRFDSNQTAALAVLHKVATEEVGTDKATTEKAAIEED